MNRQRAVMLHIRVMLYWGCDVAQAASRWLPTAAAEVRVQAAYGICGGQSSRFSPSTSVSPANHSTDFSIIIITRDWYRRPISDRRTQEDSVSLHLKKLKK
jgi:hypothetical protein